MNVIKSLTAVVLGTSLVLPAQAMATPTPTPGGNSQTSGYASKSESQSTSKSTSSSTTTKQKKTSEPTASPNTPTNTPTATPTATPAVINSEATSKFDCASKKITTKLSSTGGPSLYSVMYNGVNSQTGVVNAGKSKAVSFSIPNDAVYPIAVNVKFEYSDSINQPKQLTTLTVTSDDASACATPTPTVTPSVALETPIATDGTPTTMPSVSEPTNPSVEAPAASEQPKQNSVNPVDQTVTNFVTVVDNTKVEVIDNTIYCWDYVWYWGYWNWKNPNVAKPTKGREKSIAANTTGLPKTGN